MAWKSKQQKASSQPNKKNAGDLSFPGLKPATPDAGNKTAYVSIQNEEIMVLKSIYGDDFIEHEAANTAWKKSDPSFDIRVKASLDPDLAITLGVVFTATYPRSAPLLSLKDEGHIRESTAFKLQRFIETKPKTLVALAQGEPMLFELIQGIQDILDAAVQAKAQGVERSLEEERAAHEAELARQAREQQQQEERKRQDAAKEEERMMQEMIQKEVERKRSKAKESKKRNRRPSTTNYASEDSRLSEASKVEFDQMCEINNSAGTIFLFNAVVGSVKFRKGQVATTYLVWPDLPYGRDCPGLALKEFELRSTSKELTQFKKQLQVLEGQLEAVKKISHHNILELLNFRIDRENADDESSGLSWTARVLMPLADKGSLEELLDLSGQLAIGRVRSWTTDLLNALGHLHNNGIIHQDIHAANILLFRESTGNVVPKLADVAYQKEMHTICRKSSLISPTSVARSAYWLPPEIAGQSRPQFTQKTDVWDLGVVFLQMIFGLDVFKKFQSPAALMGTLSLSSPLHELVARFFKSDPKKRPRAFELSSSEFLATDAPILLEDTSPLLPLQSVNSLSPGFPIRSGRRDSSARRQTLSRYTEDFVEEGRLGKGGFGEVVKARKKLDGQIYAIKKITQRSQASLTEVLKEVRLLSQISHPAVVRYYNTWLEEIPDLSDTEDETSSEDSDDEDSDDEESEDTVSQNIDIQFTTSAGGLDFISSSGYPNIEFGSDDSESEEEHDDDDEDIDDSSDEETSSVKDRLANAPSPTKMRADQRRSKTIMYISMEYCDKRTLRDLIQRNIWHDTEEVWRLFRQILEGLVHIHGLNILHRDLKPENIFIGLGPDGANNVKIGDFGLATTGQFALDKAVTDNTDSNDMTRSIGTSYYVAPEVRRAGKGSYTSKVDMYSLGIMFFEMCYHPMLGMERAEKLGNLGKLCLLPADFEPTDQVQTDIIQSLVTHDVKQRPSSADLLRSGKLPIQMEDETTRRALASLTNNASPYYPKVVSTLFSQSLEPTKDYTYDISTTQPSSTELFHQGVVKEELTAIFRHHGAVETARNSLYPLSSHYSSTNDIVQLLDQNGTVVQLPYDLMLGSARTLAKLSKPVVRKSFTFGSVYRDKHNGGQPVMFGEVDFDIISANTLDLALKEAEAIKVLDEIVDSFPSRSPMCFHLGHSDLLQLIFEFCNVSSTARQSVANTLSKLNIYSWTFQKIRAELRSPLIGISGTSIDDLMRFDFRDTPGKAITRLKAIFEGSSMYERLQSTLAHLKAVVEYTKRLGVHAKIYINPLSSLKENFFSGGLLFQCIVDKKGRDVFAAGGRYDGLIRAHRPKIGNQAEGLHAVGFSLAWEKLARYPKSGSGKAFVKKPEEEPQGIFNNTKRCDVLVASFDSEVLRSTGVQLLSALWSHDVSAELANDARTPDELVLRNRDETYSWIIMIKQDSVLKIKTMDRKDVPDLEIPMTELFSWLRTALRERGSRHHTTGGARQHEAGVGAPSGSGGGAVGAHHHHHQAGGAGGASFAANSEQDVRVLVAGTRSKKFNRQMVIEQAQANAAALLRGFLDGPIAAVETSDAVLDLVRDAPLSDPEHWRRVEQSVDKNEKRYVREIHDMLASWRATWEQGNGSGVRHAFVYNFRTTKCIYYDLGL